MVLRGKIIRGEGKGRKLGYPTANIDCKKVDVHLGTGVYAATAILNEKKFIAGLVIVADPWKVEAHLVGYDGPDVYGEYLTIQPVQRISTLEKYDSEEELKKKIADDMLQVQQVFLDPE